MAIVFTGLTHNNAGTTATPATAVVSPGANSLVLVTFTLHSADATTVPNSVIGAGLTFTQVTGGVLFNAGVASYVYRALSASPGSGAITIDASNLSGTPDEWQWQVTQVDGVSTSGSNGAGAVGNTNVSGAFPGTSVSTPITVTAGNATFGYNYAHHNGGTFTPGSGYTLYGQEDDAAICQTSVEFKVAGASPVDFSYNSSQTLGVFGLEIVASTGPADTFVEAWGMQSPQRHIGPARMVASGTVSTTRLP